MEFKILINNVDMTEYVPLPISEQLTLDESLDVGLIRLMYTDKANPFPPLTSVNIHISTGDNERILYYFISSDEVTEVVQSNKYNHSIMLIEQTKWLERFIGRTKTVTNPLFKNYDKEYVFVKKSTFILGQLTEKIEQSDKQKSPLFTGSNTFMSVYEYFNMGEPIVATLQISKNNEVVAYTTDSKEALTLDLTGGVYDVLYRYAILVGTDSYLYEDTFQIVVVKSNEDTKDKTITEVVNSVLSTIETLRESETPRFSFNSEQAEKYSKISSPEFTLTGTLWEQLSQIGEYIHSIPRLRNNVIYFDELGSSEHIQHPLTNHVSSIKKFDIEQFALSLDSNVDNFMNTESISGNLGISEPFNTGFKTVRTDVSNVVMTDQNIFIETKYPIEKVLRVTCGYVDGETNIVGDITAYIYEESEYLTLSSYSDLYPLSKGFALKYVTGKNNITQLDFKLPNEFNPVFEDYAIINIIKNKLGYDIKSQNIQKLQFNVTYIPVISGRVKQVKSYIGDIETNSSLAYNQTAQKISSVAYGEALKGAIARLGNPEISRVYILEDVSLIPDVGRKFDDEYYVSAVKCEYYKDFIRCEVVLSKNFNKLNEYVGIKNDVRFYEISEKQAVDSQILYEDYCVIGDDFQSDNKSILTDINTFALSFSTNSHPDYSVVHIAEVTGYSKGVAHETVVLPVSSYALGNSLLFNFRYDDSYSAGNTVIQKGLTRVQYQLPYTDERGELDSLKIRLGETLFNANNFEDAVEKGDLFPKDEIISDNPNNRWSFETGDDKIVILKDNREIPTINYQLHFVSNNKNLVIGKWLTERNPFITYLHQVKYVTVFPTKIGQFGDSSFRFMFGRYDLNPTINGNTVDLGSFTILEHPSGITEYYSWAIVDDDDRIYLAENFPEKIKVGDTVKLPKLTFTHKIL